MHHYTYNVVVEVRKNNPYFNPFIYIKNKPCDISSTVNADLKQGKSSAGLIVALHVGYFCNERQEPRR